MLRPCCLLRRPPPQRSKKIKKEFFGFLDILAAEAAKLKPHQTKKSQLNPPPPSRGEGRLSFGFGYFFAALLALAGARCKKYFFATRLLLAKAPPQRSKKIKKKFFGFGLYFLLRAAVFRANENH